MSHPVPVQPPNKPGLPSGIPKTDVVPRAAAAQALCADLRARRRRGERVRVEDYLEQYPELRQDPEQVLDLIYQEVMLREEAGEAPQLADYLRRFGALEPQLRPIFEVHEAINLLPPEGLSCRSSGPPEKPPPPPPPSGLPAVPGYDVLGELGRGGGGVVYKARQHGLRRLVALKMLPAGADAWPATTVRFRAEALLAARLQHPNIVQVYEIGTHEGRPFFAMELVEGGNLAVRSAGNPQPVADAARLVATLARAVHAAHGKGIIHRDLKPANVLLAPPPTAEGLPAGGWPSWGCPKIADFGLAKDLGGDGASRTGDVLGTPGYMAPEQARGRVRDVGPQADVYALGAILYELLTGRPPFKAETRLETLREVLEQDPVPPRRLRNKTPRDLETICLKCLNKEPRRRYASALELAEDLDRFLDGRPVRARPISLRERAVKWARRRPATLALVVLGVVTVVALGLTWVRERGRQDAARAEVQALIRDGEAAFVRGDLSEARSRAAVALTRLRSEPLLGDLVPSADDLLARSEQRLAAQQEEREAAATWQAFLRRYDDALFHGLNALARGTLLTGMDPAAHATRAESAAREALALAGLDLDPGREWAPERRFRTPARREEVAASCYTLLLILADTLGQRPGPPDAVRAREALRLVNRAGQIQTPTRSYHLRRAFYLERLGEAAAARAEVARAESLPPAGALDHFLAGQERYQLGDVRGALPHFEAAVGVQPDHFWSQCSFAVCCLHEHRWAEARAALTVCLVKRPDFVWAWLLRSYAQREQRAFAAAKADFQRAEQLLDRQPNEDARYALLVNRGVLRFDEDEVARLAAVGTAAGLAGGRGFALPAALGVLPGTAPGTIQEAAADLEQATRLRPQQYAPHLNLARVYQRQGRAKEAERSFRQALRLHPPGQVLAAYLTEKGRFLYARGRYSEALAACGAALEHQAEHAPAHLLMGQALLLLGRDEAAVRSFDQYLAAGGVPDADVYRGRGLGRLRLGRYLEARDDLTRALERQPGPELYLQRGWAYFFLDAWQPALGDFEQALRLDPEREDAYAGRGLARVYLGRYRDAVADAGEALRRNPTTSETLHNVACIYALAASRAETDPAEKDRQALAARFHAQAVDSVRRTLARVPPEGRAAFWREKIFPDSALDSIRRAPEFRRWQEEFGPVSPDQPR
jgi:tetratricopeptide (TPR) repeat protein